MNHDQATRIAAVQSLGEVLRIAAEPPLLNKWKAPKVFEEYMGLNANILREQYLNSLCTEDLRDLLTLLKRCP